ncbi:MAG: UDP-N-acetylmuramate--L-alanine ligase [Lachnospiraceae bacterium]|nr:UDP-N-acetylmuramate--L-alanine ligase [Lachnospiraceae bacterium]
MYEINYEQPVHVHFIAIGGISMSGLAKILLTRGFTVSGSDIKASGLTEGLIKDGARISIGQKAENITEDIDLVVYSAAIHKDNPEMAEAIKRGLPLLTRAELLGQIMKNYERSIAVAGTHGKTTTTSMISTILLAADLDPTISVGGILKAIGGNIRIGKSENFLTEACEYTNSFLSFYPKYNIILNIEEDHLDFFKDIEDIRHSFKKFAELLPSDGLLVINSEIDRLSEITGDLNCKVLTFSSREEDPSSDISCKNISYDEKGCASFTLIKDKKEVTDVKLRVPGRHNVSNALAAIALCLELGVDLEAIKAGLLDFQGADRRFEYKGTLKGITLIDDYAHHPTEIRATLNAALNYPHKTLWTIFQPHTYSRTKSFFEDFAEVLSLSDRVIMADIYAARETDDHSVSSKQLSDAINKRGSKSYYFASFKEIEDFVKTNCKEGDLVITVGAGDIYKVIDDLLAE